LVGLGGGCHWCTEGVFTSLIGITKVDQGWIASNSEHFSLYEAIEVYFDPAVISLSDLIEIHLHTHASSSNHSMRGNTVQPYIPLMMFNLSKRYTF
jgi:peptide-methionine (S)-S-oxide reductase